MMRLSELPPPRQPRQTGNATGVALVGALFMAVTAPAAAEDFGITGYVEPELQYFIENGSLPGQERENLSVAAEVKLEYFWDEGDQWVVFKPFGRLDWRDGNRTHVDIRELKYARVEGDWEFRVGLDKVFWGVTEAAHLVDIINQDDFIESIDGEEKLGQPMLMVSTTQPAGTFDFYLLPYFRERTFASADGRPAADIPIDEDQTFYESSDGRKHLDFALRYSNTFDEWDVGLAFFQGTARDPLLVPGLNANAEPVLIPFYPQIRQVSVDVQATLGAWLYKFEGFWRRELNEEYINATGGIEYTFYGVLNTPGDIGIVAEYIFDDRGANPANPFANDAFAGLRWTANDTASTSLLAGGIIDLDTQATSFAIEAEKRLGDDYLISLESRFFFNVPISDRLHSISDDDFLQLRVARYF